MILVLSTDGDVTTSEVIDWILAKGKKFVRLNDNDIFKYQFNIYIEHGTIKFSFDKNGQTISSDDISTVWYRKFGFYRFADEFPFVKNTKNIDLIKQFTSEYFTILNTIILALKEKKWLLDINKATTNKFLILAEAQKVGLEIPKSFILNNKSQLNEFLSNTALITKTIKDTSQINYNGQYLSMLTTEIIPEFSTAESLPHFFMPSLTQEKIEKRYELRIFYLDGMFYSMAIFSQSDMQTQIDFRKYNYEKPNRTVPYLLPDNLKVKLTDLMKNLNLTTGSIDMIVTQDDKYIFLEVNPSGQFGMVSKPCNFPLEKEVAEYLIKISENETV